MTAQEPTRVELSRPGAVLVGTRSGAGPPVILLHAGGERRSVWDPVATRLADAGWCAIAYDQRGHGDSSAEGADRLPTFADDLVAMIGAEPGPVTVVGASLGGLASLYAVSTLDIAARLRSVILVDVVPRLDPEHVRAHLNGIRAGWGDSPFSHDVFARRPQLEAATDGLAGIPTLLVRGESSAIPDDDVAWFAGRVPHADVVTAAEAGHLVARDAPDELTRLLLEHLGRPDGPPRAADAATGP